MRKFKLIPKEIKEYLKYNPDDGSFVWIKTLDYGNAYIGQRWGDVKGSDGYLVGQFKGERYYVHRVAWYLHTGNDPGKCTVDHVNGDRSDNRFSKLRLLETDSEQNRNRAGLGYFWDKKQSMFRISIRDKEGKAKCLGSAACPLLARIVYVEKTNEWFPELNMPLLPRCEIKGRPLDEFMKEILATPKLLSFLH